MNPEEQKKLKELDKLTKSLQGQLNGILTTPPLQDHFHNGFDASPVQFADIARKKIWVHHTIVGTAAATAGNYAVFFIAPFDCTLTEFKEVHQTAGGDVGAVTLTLEKLTGTQALDAGAAMLQSTINLKATANTVQTGTLTDTLSNRALKRGDRLALDDAGTLTDVANVTVYAELQIR